MTHYTESGGEGPVIIGLHGGGAGSSGEAGMAPLMRELAPAGFRFIGLDSVGGFGKTDARAPVPYGLQSRADHLAAFADAIGLERFTVLGNSQGAWVAARYAVTHPDRVERLILIGSATLGLCMGFPEEKTPGMLAMQGYDQTREGMKKLIEGLVYHKELATDALVELRHTAASRPGAMEAFKKQVEANRYLQNNPMLRTQFQMRDSLPLLTQHIPTTVIWGEDDTFAPVTLARKLEPLLPHVKFHYLSEAGHQVQNDQPEKMARIVDEFMRTPPPPGRG
jgi:pimeloyl-ACP methyl ester carboxylesterase